MYHLLSVYIKRSGGITVHGTVTRRICPLNCAKITTAYAKEKDDIWRLMISISKEKRREKTEEEGDERKERKNENIEEEEFSD